MKLLVSLYIYIYIFPSVDNLTYILGFFHVRGCVLAVGKPLFLDSCLKSCLTDFLIGCLVVWLLYQLTLLTFPGSQSHWPSASLTCWFAACCGHLCLPLKVITVNCWYSEWVCVLEWASCQWVSSSYRSSFLTQICSPQACMQMSALIHACTLECEQWKKGVLYRNSLQLDWMQSLYCTYI